MSIEISGAGTPCIFAQLLNEWPRRISFDRILRESSAGLWACALGVLRLTMDLPQHSITYRSSRNGRFWKVFSPMPFAAKLAALMRRAGVGNRSLAQALEISHPSVGDWLKGRARPRPELAKRLAEFLNVAVDDLLDDSRELPPNPRQQMHAAIAAAPSDVRDMFLAPVSGWKHYLDLEWLFDQLLAERGGKKLTPEERADFEEMMRAFGHDRPRGRAALRRTVDIAEGIGEVVFGRHLAATGSALTAEAREMGEIKLAEIKAQAGVREKQQPEKERRHG